MSEFWESFATGASTIAGLGMLLFWMVRVAARVQKLAASRSIVATSCVVENPQTVVLLQANNLRPLARGAALRGIADEMMVYEIP